MKFYILWPSSFSSASPWWCGCSGLWTASWPSWLPIPPSTPTPTAAISRYRSWYCLSYFAPGLAPSRAPTPPWRSTSGLWRCRPLHLLWFLPGAALPQHNKWAAWLLSLLQVSLALWTAWLSCTGRLWMTPTPAARRGWPGNYPSSSPSTRYYSQIGECGPESSFVYDNFAMIRWRKYGTSQNY